MGELRDDLDFGRYRGKLKSSHTLHQKWDLELQNQNLFFS